MLLSAKSPLKVIYVERLTLEWLWKQTYRFIHSKGIGKIRVFYLDYDGPALILARGLAGICPVTFQEFRFQCAQVIDKDGISIRLKVTYKDLAMMGDLIRRDIPNLLKEDKRLALYLMKAPVSSLDYSSKDKYRFLRNAVLLINFVRWHVDKIDAVQAGTELHLFPRPFFEQLCEYAQSKDIRPCMMKSYRSWGPFWQKMGKLSSKLNGNVIRSLLRHALSAVFRFKNHQQEDFLAIDAKLLVESRLEFNLSQELISDLFFLDAQGGIRGEDVLLVFNGSFNPVDEDKFKAMRGRGIQAVALSPQSSLVSPSKVRVFHIDKEKISAKGRKKEDEFPTDFKVFAAEYFQQRSFWKEFFTRNNVRLWTSFYKNEPLHIAMADALTAVGGISAIYQRSYESNPSIVLTIGSDIIFSFSKAEYGIEMQNNSDFRYHVATGYLGDYRFGYLKAGAGQLRERLARAGAKHIIAYFDENTINDVRWFFDQHFAQENYAFWIEKLLANSALGLIFKPKVPKTLRRRLGAVSELLTRAQETGRCYVFEEGSIQSAFPPSAASLASDVAIHDMLSAGTAGLESALAGTKTILMDFEGWPRSPLYGLGDEVVFRNRENAWQACLEYFKNPLEHPRLGDWSAMVNELDPFHDGHAAERMSGYLKELLEGLRRGEVPADVMEKAAENYADRWGKDKVQRGPRA